MNKAILQLGMDVLNIYPTEFPELNAPFEEKPRQPHWNGQPKGRIKWSQTKVGKVPNGVRVLGNRIEQGRIFKARKIKSR